MKLAIIGSRTLSVDDLGKYLPQGITEIVSGGAIGIDRQAAEHAKKNNIPLTEFLPDYARYKRGAPLQRNKQIAQYADAVLAFWDGRSKGTQYTIQQFEKLGKQVIIVSFP